MKLRVAAWSKMALLLWAVQLCVAWAASTPLVTALAGSGVARFPEGDALLFSPGALLLTEVVRLSSTSLVSAVPLSVSVLVLGSALQLAAVAAALNFLSPLRQRFAVRAARVLPSFVLLWGLTLLCQTIVVLIAAVFGATLARHFDSPRAQDLCQLGWIALGVFAALLVGILHDLSRAARVQQASDPWAALTRATYVFGKGPWRILLSWFCTAATGATLIGLGALAAHVLAVHEPGGWRVAALFAAHQICAFGLAFVRAFWLDAALRFTADGPPVLDDTPAGSDAPVDPTPDPAA